jgi:hypothetical protein
MNGISQFIQGAMKLCFDDAGELCHRSSCLGMAILLQFRQGLNSRSQIGRRAGKTVRPPSSNVFPEFPAGRRPVTLSFALN